MAKPFKIAIDGREISPNSAGKGRYITEFVRHLAQLDKINEYILYISQPMPYDLPSNFQVVRIEGSFGVKQFKMVHDAKSRHCQLFFAPTGYLPVLLSTIPTVIVVHDLALLASPQARPALKTRLGERLLKSAVKKADAIIAISESTKNDLIRFFNIPAERITVTLLGYDTSLFHQANVQEQQQDRAIQEKYALKPNYLLFVGTLEPRKNIVGIIEAYGLLSKELQQKHPLYIGGKKGWFYEEIFAKVTELKLNDSIQFLGRVPDEDLPSLYRQAHCFVFPSFYEGFGLPPLEALACETPVISATNSSLPEVVGEAGLLVDAQSKQELSQAMETMLTDTERYAQFKQKTLVQAQKFQWEKTAQQTLDLFLQIAKNRNN